jgi:galactokinase
LSSDDLGAALRALRGRTHESAIRRNFVPGRIEFLGKHTDYAGGRSLLCTVDRGFRLASVPRADRTLRVLDVRLRRSAEVELDSGVVPSAPDWRVYVEAVAGRLARNFPGVLLGADIALASDLPPASGLSSSSALVVGLFFALAEHNALFDRPEWAASIKTREDLAGYLGCLENGRGFRLLSGQQGVGTLGGSEDQTAMLCSREGQIGQFVFCPVRSERFLALGPEWSLVVAFSGVASDKTGGVRERFNELSLSAAAILDLWNRETGFKGESLFASATRDPETPERLRQLLRDRSDSGFPAGFLLRRLDQLLEESGSIIPEVGDLLGRKTIPEIGPLVDRSQELAEKCLENQIPETVALQRSARELGAAAASAFGGGFGGSVWALVETDQAAEFQRRWSERYVSSFPGHAARAIFFVTRPGGGVRSMREA